MDSDEATVVSRCSDEVPKTPVVGHYSFNRIGYVYNFVS